MLDSENGMVKFIDFGLACQTNSKSKEVAGTPYYIAPEVIDKKYNEACDIWSLGVVIYFMMSGKMPFMATSQNSLFKKI